MAAHALGNTSTQAAHWKGMLLGWAQQAWSPGSSLLSLPCSHSPLISYTCVTGSSKREGAAGDGQWSACSTFGGTPGHSSGTAGAAGAATGGHGARQSQLRGTQMLKWMDGSNYREGANSGTWSKPQ
eukprot:1158835-Pelagomonas_calceolata.AAC.17